MAPSRRKGADKIDDPKQCATTFSKRSRGLIKKASALNSLTGARVAVIVFSPNDKLCFFGAPSVEEVFFEYLRRKGGVTLPKSPKEGMDWAENATEELKDFENNPSVNAGAGVDRFTSLMDSAAGGGSSEMDADPMCSNLYGSGLDLNGLLNFSEDNDL